MDTERMHMFACTYHSPFPNDTHPVLDSGHTMRDLCEIIFAQSSLLGAKWTVFWCHNAQSVTENGCFHFDYIVLNNADMTVISFFSSTEMKEQVDNVVLWWEHTCRADPWGSQVCLGRCAEAGRWHEPRREPSPGDSSGIHSGPHERLWSLHVPPSLRRPKKAALHHPPRQACHPPYPPPQLTLHLGSSNHISSRHTGHIDEVNWAASLQRQLQTDEHRATHTHTAQRSDLKLDSGACLPCWQW